MGLIRYAFVQIIKMWCLYVDTRLLEIIGKSCADVVDMRLLEIIGNTCADAIDICLLEIIEKTCAYVGGMRRDS